MTPTHRTLPRLLLAALAASLLTVAPASADDDLVPDELEPTLCANENPNFEFEGTCEGDDYSIPTLAGIVRDLNYITPPLLGDADEDRDYVLDALEPTLCANENPLFEFEGTCDGDDYHAPSVAGIQRDLDRI